MNSRRRLSIVLARLGPFAAAGLGPLLLLGGRLISGQAIFWGLPVLQFVPWWLEVSRQISQGRIPQWNDLNGLGAPLLANYQTAVFYPPNWLLFLFSGFGPGAVAWGYSLLAVIHLAWAGMGMVYLLRRLGVGGLGQAVGGIALSMCAYFVARISFVSMIWAAAWLPWLLAMVTELAASQPDGKAGLRSWLSYRLMICFAFQFLAGHAQWTWYSILLTGVWLVMRLVIHPRADFMKVLARFVAAGILAAGIAAVQLLPTAEYLMQSSRAQEFGYADAVVYSFWPWRIISLFASDFFGNPGKGSFWGYATYWEDALYIGMLPLVLVLSTVSGFFRSKPSDPERPNKKMLWFLWGLIGVSFVLGLGQNTPVFPFFYHYIPTFSLFQAPARFLLWAEIALVILAAIAVEGWKRPEGKGLYWLRLGTAGACAVMVGAGLAWLGLKDIKLTFISSTALAGFWVVGVCLLSLFRPRSEGNRWMTAWKVAAAGWVLLDLVWAGWFLNPTLPVTYYSQLSDQVSQLRSRIGTGVIYMPEAVERELKFKQFFKFENYLNVGNWTRLGRVLLPNLNLLGQVKMANNFDPLVPGLFLEWQQAVEKMDPLQQNTWLEMAGVSSVAVLDDGKPDGVWFKEIQTTPRYVSFICAEYASSKVDAVQRVEASPNSESRLILSGTDLKNTCPAGSNLGKVELLADQPGEKRLAVQMPEAGWVRVAQIYYPGWEAWVDGNETPILHANAFFTAFAVPMGQHEVTFRYRPLSFRIGLLLSILIIVALLVFPPGVARLRAKKMNH